MTRTRLLIAGMPPILRGIIRVLAADRPALEIVAELEPDEDLVAAASVHRADVVLMFGSVAEAQVIGQRVLDEHPKLRLVVMSEDARTAHLHRLLPHQMTFHDVSPHELLDVILDARRDDARR